MKSKFLPFTDLELQIKSLVPNIKFFILPCVREFRTPDKKRNILYYGSFREELNVVNSLLSEDLIPIDTTPTIFSHIEPNKIAYFQGYEIIFAIPIFPPVVEVFDFYIGNMEEVGENLSMIFYAPVDSNFSLYGAKNNTSNFELLFQDIEHGFNIGDFYSSFVVKPVDFSQFSHFYLKDENNETFTPVYIYGGYVASVPHILLQLSEHNDQQMQIMFLPDYDRNSNFLLQKSINGVDWTDFNIPQYNEYDDLIQSNVVQPNTWYDHEDIYNCKLRIYDALNLVVSNEMLYGALQVEEPVLNTAFYKTELTQIQYKHGLTAYVDFINASNLQERKYITFIAGFEEIQYLSIINLVNCHEIPNWY